MTAWTHAEAFTLVLLADVYQGEGRRKWRRIGREMRSRRYPKRVASAYRAKVRELRAKMEQEVTG
jgi:hypothetical protein